MSKGPKSALQEGDDFFEGDPLQMMVGGMEGSPVRSTAPPAAGKPPTQPKRDLSSDSLVSLDQQQQQQPHHHHSMRPKTLSFGQGFQVRY